MDEDAKAKERARQQTGRVVMTGSVASQERETSGGAAARLDDRISGQRKGYNGAADKEAKDRARRTNDGSTPGVYRVPPSALKELSRMEPDAAAKARARPGAGQSVQAVQPGGYKVVDSPAPPSGLGQMESDIAAKQRARPAANGIRNEIAQLESDVAAKSRARSAAQPATTAVYREPPARAELSQLERDVAAKNRARQERATATTPGAQGLRNMEAAVVQKTRAVSQGSARQELTQLEADLVTKQGQRPHTPASRPGITMMRDMDERGITMMRNMDERIAYKTGIPLDDDQKQSRSTQNTTNRAGSGSKVTGDPADTVSASLERENKLGSGGQYHGGIPGSRPFLDIELAAEERDKLAVAKAVKEDDEDAFIPAAVEYDPDAKPPIYTNRRFRLYGLLACTLLAVVVVGVVVAVVSVRLLAQKEETIIVDIDSSRSWAPTNPRFDLGIQEQLELVVGSEKLSEKGSAHFQALEWIILEDPMQLLPEDSNLIQRFLLAAFYFQTHAEGEWLSCNKQKETDPDESCSYQKLISVYPSEYRGIAWFRWLSSKHECMWAGVFCDEFDQMRHIDLTGQQIKASLPVDLAYFPFLQGMALSWNEFRGTIPPEYGEINHLLNFEVHYNALTGNVPAWPKAKNIQLLNLGANEFTGTLPEDIKYLSNLKGFFAFDNFLTGTFPKELAELSHLSKLLRNFISKSCFGF